MNKEFPKVVRVHTVVCELWEDGVSMRKLSPFKVPITIDEVYENIKGAHTANPDQNVMVSKEEIRDILNCLCLERFLYHNSTFVDREEIPSPFNIDTVYYAANKWSFCLYANPWINLDEHKLHKVLPEKWEKVLKVLNDN